MRKDDFEKPDGSIREHKHSVMLAEALARLPGPDGERFTVVFEHDSLQVEIHAPRGRDSQTPHTRDEV